MSVPPENLSMLPAAKQKREHREAILERYSDWRLSLSPSAKLPDDVSSLILSKLTPLEFHIVHLDATALVEHIAARKLSSVQVLTAFTKTAVAAQDLTNCLTEIFIDEAFQRARELDHYQKTTGKVVGPLHGLPVSVKDHIFLKGYDTSTGYVAWANKYISESDAVVVQLLRQAGAVLYVKTANPQSLLSLETHNHIYGRTLNPFNRNLTPGGSSGGEGALIAARGSPLGIGTDIGGSIRTPAAHCGLYGMKASVARMPHSGLQGSQDGMDNIVGVVGPLAHSARDLALFSKVMLQYEPWHIEGPLLNMPWKEDIANGKGLPNKLSIAILSDDGVVRPHPPLIRELERTRKALIAAGHDVIDWIPLNHREGWDLIVKFYFLDGGEEYYETLGEGQEEPTPSFEWILSFIEKKDGQRRPPYTTRETWKLNREREEFRTKALAHWNATSKRTKSGRPVDAIITAPFATLAPQHDKTAWWGYTSQWNLLDLPGVVFPTGARCHSADYPIKEALPPARNEIEENVRAQWNPATFENAPVSLQVVGRRHEEEKLLAILNVVEQVRKEYRYVESVSDSIMARPSL